MKIIEVDYIITEHTEIISDFYKKDKILLYLSKYDGSKENRIYKPKKILDSKKINLNDLIKTELQNGYIIPKELYVTGYEATQFLNEEKIYEFIFIYKCISVGAKVGEDELKWRKIDKCSFLLKKIEELNTKLIDQQKKLEEILDRPNNPGCLESWNEICKIQKIEKK